MLTLLRPLALLAALAASADACAQAVEAPPRSREVRRDEAADSVRRIERETGGEVLRSDRMQRDGRDVYRVKVLTPEGRVRVMQDDPGARRDRAREEAAAREAERARAREVRRDRGHDDPVNNH